MRHPFKGRFEVAWYVLAFALACSYLALVEGAVAGESNFHLHTMTQHFDDTDREYNENNWGMGFTRIKDYGSIGYTTGIYNNSSYNTSIYIGGVYKPDNFMSFSILGITGYDSTVLIAPTINIHFLPNTKIGPVLTVVPTNVGFVTLFSLEWRFNGY